MRSFTRILALAAIVLLTAAVLSCSTAHAADKLAAPTNLKWETEYRWFDYDDGSGEWVSPGYLYWEDRENTGADYSVNVYSKSGVFVTGANWCMDGEDAEQFYSDAFVWNGLRETGEYYFTVQAIDPDGEKSGSDVVKSGYWSYTKPSKVLAVPTGFRFAGAHLIWDPVEGAGGYQVEVYYSGSAGTTGDLVNIYGANNGGHFHFKDLTEEKGAGYYSFRVRTMSPDITKACHSDWSGMQTVHWTTSSLGDFDFDKKTGTILRCNLEQAESITVPASIDGTTVSVIDRTAFARFTKLKRITLPGTLTEIRGSAFNKSTAITDVYFKGSRTKWNAIKIDSFNVPLVSAAIHCEGSTKNNSMKNVSQEQVYWEYYGESKEIAVSGKVAADKPVLVASYGKNGRFLGLTPLTESNSAAALESGAEGAAVFWVDGNAAPLAEHNELPTL